MIFFEKNAEKNFLLYVLVYLRLGNVNNIALSKIFDLVCDAFFDNFQSLWPLFGLMR